MSCLATLDRTSISGGRFMVKRLYQIEKQSHCVRVVFERGMMIGPRDIIAAIDQENALYSIEGRHDLWDFRGCSAGTDFHFAGMNRVVDRIKHQYGRANEKNKTALLVEGSTPFGLSRMFQLLMDGYPTQIGIFKDEAAATQWISKIDNP
jgi:hypothetical protein